ncbi:MAG: response regulator [Chloroflexi bacterium]|nr:response regulator [Chloroflexota bacterium]
MTTPEAILIVDDDRGLQETLQGILDFEGYEPMLAGDGIEALAQIDRHRPDAIILDLMMPRMDGWTFARELDQRGLRPGIPLIVLTADGRAQEKGEQVGADAALAKPFDLDILLDTLARLVGR